MSVTTCAAVLSTLSQDLWDTWSQSSPTVNSLSRSVLLCCAVNSFQLLMGHTKQPVFAIVPDLVPVQLHGQPPELLLQSLRSRNVAILDPSRSLLQSHVGDLSRRSAVSCFPRSSSPVSALYVLRRRSLFPSTTKFSNSGRSSSRTDLASNSSGHATSYQSDRGEYSFLDGSIEVLREPLGVQLTLVAIVLVSS